jgi:hypothetical protein
MSESIGRRRLFFDYRVPFEQQLEGCLRPLKMNVTPLIESTIVVDTRMRVSIIEMNCAQPMPTQ